MFLSRLNMGKHFGDLAYIRGIVYYKMSPHEQKPLAGSIRYGLPNMLPRITATMHTWLPPFVLGFIVYKFVETAHHQKNRKDPKDYINEVDSSADLVVEKEPEKKKC